MSSNKDNVDMSIVQQFERERKMAMQEMNDDHTLKEKALDWMIHSDKYKYTYNFRWLGRPVIKYPQDILLLQEIIWDTKPDLIIETGIAHGGSIVFSASMLELIGKGEVLAIDIDIRKHNKKLIEEHPMYKRITMINGSSVDTDVFSRVKEHAQNKQKVMVILDSLHTYEHVAKEIDLYAPLVSKNCFLVVCDTFIEYFPQNYFSDRPWDVGNNPMTAVKEFMKDNKDFVIDTHSDKLLISEIFQGYLRKTT